MKIEKDKVVTISYTLKESDGSGEVIQEVNNKEPFSFLFGHNQILPQFETELIEKENGTQFEFEIKSEDGYGERNPDAVTDLPIDLFQKDGKLNEHVQLGHFLPMNDAEGNELQGLVLEINDKTVKMDFNHPMAGLDLYFSGEVIDVREATKEEIENSLTQGN
ncbi:FKBP-type peptidyl-prolyl cis-trans isomerase [Reichenbachiella versicolor]|uniref:FKBP-type peptidyl-prolyl cis-trans isomerase n=1 Tax=Reichenbachiella versicolor TaxID=1821036 RepID=UPI000D6E8368|nr:peptidylprolyl isomerase [Reichenbachiella versicolor]